MATNLTKDLYSSITKMNLFTKHLSNLTLLTSKKTLFFLASFLSTAIISSEKVNASSQEDACNNVSGYPIDSVTDGGGSLVRINSGNGCTISPSGYIVRAFELGICNADNNPWSSTGLDTSGCEVIWKSNVGEEANLVTTTGVPKSYNLSEEGIERPKAGTYSYGYIIIDDTIRLKASLVLNNQTWHTTVRHLEHTIANPDEGYQASLGKLTGEAEFVDTRLGFFENPSLGGGDISEACHIESFDTGKGVTFSGLILNADKKTRSTPTATRHNRTNTANSAVYCAGSKYLAGVQTFTSPVVIKETSSSFDLSFDTTDTGAWVESYSYAGTFTPSDGVVNRPFFDIGPFIIRMTVQ